jgi:hypothetical protein
MQELAKQVLRAQVAVVLGVNVVSGETVHGVRPLAVANFAIS